MRVTVVCVNDFPVRVFLKEDEAKKYRRVNHRPEQGQFVHFYTFGVEESYWTPSGSNFPD